MFFQHDAVLHCLQEGWLSPSTPALGLPAGIHLELNTPSMALSSQPSFPCSREAGIKFVLPVPTRPLQVSVQKAPTLDPADIGTILAVQHWPGPVPLAIPSCVQKGELPWVGNLPLGLVLKTSNQFNPAPPL